MRIRRDTYDLTGAAITKEIVHGITSLNATRAAAADLARLTQGQWGIESVHWSVTPLTQKTRTPATRGMTPRSWPPYLLNIVISLLHLADITEITRTIQRITRDRTRALLLLPL